MSLFDPAPTTTPSAATPPASPASAPSSAPDGGAAPAAPGGTESGSSTQPSTAAPSTPTPPATAAPEAPATPDKPAANAAPAKADEPDPFAPKDVPYPKFKEVQTNFTRLKGAFRTEVGKRDAEIQRLNTEAVELRKAKTDLDTLEELLNENPDLMEALYERAGSRKPPTGGPGRTAAPAQPLADPRLDEMHKTLKELQQERLAERQARAQQEERQALQQASQRLDDTLKPWLEQSGFKPGWLPKARGYVLERIRQLSQGNPDIEWGDDELRALYSEWHRDMRKLLDDQAAGWRQGKTQDQNTLPPAAGTQSGTAPIVGKPSSGANDSTTSQRLESLLTERLGWGDNANGAGA